MSFRMTLCRFLLLLDLIRNTDSRTLDSGSLRSHVLWNTTQIADSEDPLLQNQNSRRVERYCQLRNMFSLPLADFCQGYQNMHKCAGGLWCRYLHIQSNQKLMMKEISPLKEFFVFAKDWEVLPKSINLLVAGRPEWKHISFEIVDKKPGHVKDLFISFWIRTAWLFSYFFTCISTHQTGRERAAAQFVISTSRVTAECFPSATDSFSVTFLTLAQTVASRPWSQWFWQHLSLLLVVMLWPVAVNRNFQVNLNEAITSIIIKKSISRPCFQSLGKPFICQSGQKQSKQTTTNTSTISFLTPTDRSQIHSQQHIYNPWDFEPIDHQQSIFAEINIWSAIHHFLIQLCFDSPSFFNVWGLNSESQSLGNAFVTLLRLYPVCGQCISTAH